MYACPRSPRCSNLEEGSIVNGVHHEQGSADQVKCLCHTQARLAWADESSSAGLCNSRYQSQRRRSGLRLYASTAQKDADTRRSYAQLDPLNRTAQAEEVAEAILWLCSDTGFCTGSYCPVDGG